MLSKYLVGAWGAQVCSPLPSQVHVGEVEAEKAQLQLLRATLTSKLELKDQQLAEMQATVVVGKHACT